MDPIQSRDTLFQILEFKKTHKVNNSLDKEKELNDLYEIARKSTQSNEESNQPTKPTTTPNLLDDDLNDADFDFDDSGDIDFCESCDSDEEQVSLTDIEIQRRLDRAIGESDISSEVYFHVNLYSKTEKTILFLKCGYVLYDITQSYAQEKTMVFLLTTERVFILQPTESGFELLHSITFSEIMYVTIGLFFQYFRLELAKGGSHVFLTRSFRDTEKCYRLLVATAKVAGNGAILFSKVYKNEEILANISTIIPRPEHTLLSPKKSSYVKPFVELYILVYFVPLQSETSWTLPNPLQSATQTFTPNIKLPQKVTPKSLIVADDHILLVKENFASWPTLNHNPVTKLNHFQFTVAQKQPFQSIHLLTSSPKKRNYLKITFTGEEGLSSEWELYTQSYDEMDKIISRISILWQDMFQIPLKIINETK